MWLMYNQTRVRWCVQSTLEKGTSNCLVYLKCDSACLPESASQSKWCLSDDTNMRLNPPAAILSGGDIIVKCHSHPLKKNVRTTGSWACDGKSLPGGCKKGCTGFGQTRGWTNYCCTECDYDMCDACVVSEYKSNSETGVHLVGGGEQVPFAPSIKIAAAEDILEYERTITENGVFNQYGNDRFKVGCFYNIMHFIQVFFFKDAPGSTIIFLIF